VDIRRPVIVPARWSLQLRQSQHGDEWPGESGGEEGDRLLLLRGGQDGVTSRRSKPNWKCQSQRGEIYRYLIGEGSLMGVITDRRSARRIDVGKEEEDK